MDESILEELSALSKNIFLENCSTPLLIMWNTPAGTIDSSTGEVAIEDIYHQVKVYCTSQESKYITSQDSTVINLIPMNNRIINIDYNDRVNFDIMTQEEKDTLRVVLYYNTDNPESYSVDLGSISIVYFMGKFTMPESQKMMIKRI